MLLLKNIIITIIGHWSTAEILRKLLITTVNNKMSMEYCNASDMKTQMTLCVLKKCLNKSNDY